MTERSTSTRLSGGVKFPRNKKPVPGHPHMMAVLQPRPAALEYLAELVDGRAIGFINYIELALDVIVSDREEAHRLFEYLTARLVQKWYKGGVQMHGNGCYFGGRRWGRRQFVMYWDRPSKIIDAPCLHIEMRLSGKAQCRRSNVGTFHHLLDHDHGDFWAKTLRLEEVNLCKLGRQFRGRSRAKRLDAMDVRVGGMLAIASQGMSPGIKAQEIRSRYGGRSWFRPAICMVRLDTRPYLPSGPSNVYVDNP